MHPFCTPWKPQKTSRFSDVFTGYRKGALGTNGLSNTLWKLYLIKVHETLFLQTVTWWFFITYLANCIFFFFFYKYLNAFTQYFLKISLKQQFFLWNFWKSRIVKGQYSFLSATGASTLFLTHFSPVSHLYTPCKRQKTCGFLTFLVDIEIWHWLKWVKIRFLKASFENWTHDC